MPKPYRAVHRSGVHRAHDVVVERKQLACPSEEVLPLRISSTLPPLPRTITVCPRTPSSRCICREIADWVRPTRAAARVKLFSSAMATKLRSRSRSRPTGMPMVMRVAHCPHLRNSFPFPDARDILDLTKGCFEMTRSWRANCIRNSSQPLLEAISIVAARDQARRRQPRSGPIRECSCETSATPAL